MGMTVDVFVEDVDDRDKVGYFSAEDSRIAIQPMDSDEYLMATFWHEFMHCVFSTLGYEDDNSNEQKIDQIAQCLLQLHKTCVFEADVKDGKAKRKKAK